jgi:hypothetical protein
MLFASARQEGKERRRDMRKKGWRRFSLAVQ